MPHRVVFMGSPAFSVPSLLALAGGGYDIAGVVTQPDRPAGRGGKIAPPAVKEAALELGLALIQPAKLSETDAMEQLRAWQPEVIVVVAFGQILRSDVLSVPQFGCLNVHGSLLPRWRGAAPIQAAILAGDEQTGATIMKMDPGIDTGPLLSQRAIPIRPDDTAGLLFERLSTLGADLLLEALPAYLARQILPQPQPEEGATYAPMLKKEDGRLDWALPARELARRVRAFNPWPGAFFEWQEGALKVLRAHPAEARAEPGQQLVYEKLPAVGTGEGLLVLDEVQPPGKKPMGGKAFLAGARGWPITNKVE